MGGAPISQMFADEIGADGYGANASAAVDLFLRLGGRAQDEPAPAPTVAARDAETGPVRQGTRTTYQILYWQEVPVQIRAEDDAGNEVTVELPRAVARVDLLASQRGLSGGDDFSAQYRWGDEIERDGSAADVMADVQAEYEAGAPQG